MTIYIGENIKRLRRERNISQETLALFLGVTFQSVSKWERGESYPDITTLPSIASFFNVTVDDLLGFNKVLNAEKLNKYLKIYDTMKLKDIAYTLNEFERAVKEFPGDFRILIRYMQLLQEEALYNHSTEIASSDKYKKPCEKIAEIYANIQKHCTDDSIRIWSKRIMVSNLMWKYDCICNEKGKYQFYTEYLDEAKAIVETLPSIHDTREILAIDREDYYNTHKNTLEELIFLLHIELSGYCLNLSPEDNIKQYEALLVLLDLIYSDNCFGKNSFNRLYNLGHIGHLYQQIGDDRAAIKHLKSAASYAKELDDSPETSEQIKRFYNYGTAYRELSASQFMKCVMTEHYPLSDEFKATKEFQEIVSLLS